MTHDKQGKSDTEVPMFMVGVLLGAVISGVVCYEFGYKIGVREHADGRAVVDTLSNGSKVVTKVEKKEPQ